MMPIKKNNIPSKLGFKETKLGWIPEDWVIDKLDNLITLESGQHLDKEDYSSKKTGIPYFTGPTDITNSISKVKKWTDVRNKVSFKGEVLITVKGSGVGALALCSLTEVALGRQLMSINGVKSDNLFLFYILNEKRYKFQQLASGNMIPGLSRKDILLTKSIIPPLPEQKIIANCLSTWDTAITKQDALIKAKQQLKKALMQQLLSGEKRLSGFNKEWEEKRVEDFASEYSEKNDANEPIEVLSCTKYDGLVPSLEYFGRQVFGDDLSKYKIVPHGYFAYATNHIEEGSIGYQDFNKFGLVSPMYTIFKTKETIDDNYLFKVLKSHKLIHEYNRRMEGSIDRRGGLRWKNFKGIKINMPPIKEQIAIAQVLNTADQEISLLTTQRNQLQLQKKGLMQQLLSGKKRLKV
ncbi:type I restriction enzyme S subunit [Winogradskyella pacifica]|uniref:Type I restriction enzyme S subunit n=1 Tax=Winogradskyella pacifica TaxID=664642 RepID=A0A3D9N2U4_9FLAO|nr:restriction endonuclease subunit S [Winogradskyella pacifica]REE27261.1 type I restriction enzyme S subunit [Winogradskyella pacifica]